MRHAGSEAITEVEQLEKRKHFALSVTANTLFGPTTAGTTHTYAFTVDGKLSQTATQTIYGPVQLRGQTVLRTDATLARGRAQSFVSTFTTADKRIGLAAQQSDGRDPRSGTSYTQTFKPGGDVFIPAAMTAGRSYSFSGTRTVVSRLPNRQNTTTSEVHKVFSLRNKTTRVSTDIGRFRCFLVDSVETINFGQFTTTVYSTDYYTAGLGLVKRVTVSSVSLTPNTKTMGIEQITAFKAGR